MKRDERKVFMARTLQMFHDQRRRARKKSRQGEIDYTLEMLRGAARQALGIMPDDPAFAGVKPEAFCRYCRMTLVAGNFSGDHELPIGRGGSFSWKNLDLDVCQGCNKAKGRLTAPEFRKLIELAEAMDPAAKRDILARLKAGSSCIARG